MSRISPDHIGFQHRIKRADMLADGHQVLDKIREARDTRRIAFFTVGYVPASA
jgi:hypothetical protein